MHYSPWKALKQGDIIDVIAPAFACLPDVIPKSAEFIRSLGYVPRVPADILGEDLFCANRDEIRFEHLKNALLAEDSAAIWCVKGGYGSPRLIPHLERLAPPQKSKLLIGFSDVTAIHLFLQQRWGWSSMHAKMLFVFCRDKVDQPAIDELKILLTGEKKEVLYRGLTALNAAAQDNMTISSVITGGNLSLVQTSLATSWQLDSKNKILFLEDIGERGYKIDRKLEQMRQAGMFDEALAVVFGDFTEGDELDGTNLVEQTLHRFAASVDIPVVRIAGIGHDVVNHPLPFGTHTELHLGEAISLKSRSGCDS